MFNEDFWLSLDIPSDRSVFNNFGEGCKNPGRNYIHLPPSPPLSGQKTFFRGGGGGVGVYILRPHAAGILYAPPFYTPPHPQKGTSEARGWGCIKFGPVKKHCDGWGKPGRRQRSSRISKAKVNKVQFLHTIVRSKVRRWACI